MVDSPLPPAWRRYAARAPETADERDERFVLHAALAFLLAALIGVALVAFAPLMLFQSTVLVHQRPSADDGLGIAFWFGAMLATLSSLGVGLAAYLLWKSLIVAPRRLGFYPGAQVGLLLALLLCVPLYLFLLSMFNDHPESNAPTDATPTNAALLLTAVFAVPTALVGASIGGLMGSAQLRETLEDDDSAA